MRRWFDLSTTLYAPKEDGDGSSGDDKGEKGDKGGSDKSGDDDDEDDEEDEEDDSSEDEEDGEDGLSEEEAKHAKKVFQTLKDPKQRETFIRELARVNNIELGKPVTKDTTDKQIEKKTVSIVDALKESLGKEYEFLADKLAPGIEKILLGEREAVNQRVGSSEAKQTEIEIDAVYAKLNRETKGDFRKFEKEITELADEILPAPGVSLEKYIRNLYNMASAGKGASSSKKNLADKINRNASNAAERLANGGGGGKGSSNKGIKKDASLRDIVTQVVQNNMK